MHNRFNDIDPDQNDALYFVNQLDGGSATRTEYYSVSDYNSMITKTSQLSLLSYNIRSFNANSASFQSFLESIDRSLDFVVLVETWNSANTYQLCSLSGYNGFHVCRNLGNGGGVSIFVKCAYEAVKLDSLSMLNSTIEICSAKIKVGNYHVVIIAIYRPHEDSISNFNDVLESLLRAEILKGVDLVIVTGDMNINISTNLSPNSRDYISILSSLHFLSVINEPTRFQPNNPLQSPSTLDHLWINKKIKHSAGIIDYDVTDHCPIFINFELHDYSCLRGKSRKVFRPFSQNCLEILRRKVEQTNWDELFHGNHTNSMFEIFLSTINKLYCESFPLKIKYLSDKRKSKPWITKEIKDLINQKSYYFNLFRKNLISKSMNNSLKNKINRTIRDAKTKYLSNSFQSGGKNTKKTWDLLNGLIGQDRVRNNIESINSDGIVLSSEQDIAEKFVDFFSSVGRNLDEGLVDGHASPYQFIDRNPRSFYLFPLLPIECKKLIKSLKETNSEINHIPVKNFKRANHANLQNYKFFLSRRHFPNNS